MKDPTAQQHRLWLQALSIEYDPLQTVLDEEGVVVEEDPLVVVVVVAVQEVREHPTRLIWLLEPAPPQLYVPILMV